MPATGQCAETISLWWLCLELARILLGSPTATPQAQSGRLGVHRDSCRHHRQWLRLTIRSIIGTPTYQMRLGILPAAVEVDECPFSTYLRFSQSFCAGRSFFSLNLRQIGLLVAAPRLARNDDFGTPLVPPWPSVSTTGALGVALLRSSLHHSDVMTMTRYDGPPELRKMNCLPMYRFPRQGEDHRWRRERRDSELAVPSWMLHRRRRLVHRVGRTHTPSRVSCGSSQALAIITGSSRSRQA
jgi:hypothetical protein